MFFFAALVPAMRRAPTSPMRHWPHPDAFFGDPLVIQMECTRRGGKRRCPSKEGSVPAETQLRVFENIAKGEFCLKKKMILVLLCVKILEVIREG